MATEASASNDSELPRERQLFEELRIPEGTAAQAYDVSAVKQRRAVDWYEAYSARPQNLFLVELGNVTYVGRKLVSRMRLTGEIAEMCDSQITPSMLLGVFSTVETDENGVRVYYHPLTPSERLQAFGHVLEDLQHEIQHPFSYLDASGKAEVRSSASGWQLTSKDVELLGKGEERLRWYTGELLARFDMRGKRVYDPACSTGQFLASIKARYPDCHTIGQDLSAQMIAHARALVDEVIVGNAIESPVQRESVDFLFIRFLNSKVVTRAEARVLFPPILDRLRRGGHLIVFGHTPVQLNRHHFATFPLERLQCIGHDPETTAIFQYYVFRKS